MKALLKHKYLHRSVIALTLLLVLAVAATALIPSSFIRDKLASSFGGRLGRDVTVEGPFDIQWRWGRTLVTAEQVRITNVEGAKDPYMVDVEKVAMRLKILPLLLGRMDISELHLTKPRIILEKYGDGKNNWSSLPPKTAALKEATVPDNRHEFPAIANLRIEGGELVFRDVPRKLELNLQLEIAHATDRAAPEVFTFAGSGTLEGRKLDVTGEGGSIHILRDTTADYPLKLTVSMGGTRAVLDGTFRDPVKLAGVDARLELRGRSLSDLFHLTHIPLPPTPAYTLKGRLSKDGEKWAFNDFRGKVDNSDLSGNVVYDTSKARPLLSGKVRSAHLDVDDLGGFIGYTRRIKPPGGRLLPVTPLNLTRFRASDINLVLHADKLSAPGWPLRNMDAHFKLERGLLEVRPLSFGAAGGTVSGVVTVNGRTATPTGEIDLSLKGLGLGQFLRTAKLGTLSQGLISGKVALEGRGKSTADMLASSHGRIVLTMTGGRLSLAAVEAADLDFAEMLPLMGSDKTTELRCAAGDFGVKDGLLRSRIFVIDTEDSTFKGEATVSLRNERINIRLDPQPKDGSLLALQSDVLVTGTFKNPDFGIDMGKAGMRAGGAVALAAINPIASLLALIEPASGNDVNCSRLLANAHAHRPATPARNKGGER